jgi:aspartyl-tRNA(Asn)/glutamyl-tRNA(Gln) amidotransferase subunit A
MASDRELNYASVDTLRSLLDRGAVSSAELIENTLARLDETQPILNAFSHVDAEGARTRARELDSLRVRRRSTEPRGSPIEGIPVSVKELVEVAGLPCRYGSLTMAHHQPTEDAPSVARLRAAGAVIVGMTNTSEYGFRGYTDNRVTGLTRNPWDIERSPGGSSGGAASSVAAGITPLAIGTDGGGSIRNPSSLTGLVGIKAQFGRVPIYPASATATLAHVGPIARSSADARHLLETIAGEDARDWSSLLADMNSRPSLSSGGLPAIAFAPTLGYGLADPEVANIVRQAVTRLAASFPIEEITGPICEDESEVFSAEFIGGVSARFGSDLDRQAELLDPALLMMLRRFREMSAPHYTELLRRRQAHRNRLRIFFERWPVLITPMMPWPALKIGERMPPGCENFRLWTFFSYPFNLSGQPAATLPCGFTSTGLPVGLQVVVPPQHEVLLMDLLERFEQAMGLEIAWPELHTS